MEPHAPKDQRTLFDDGCTKRKRLSNEQSRELKLPYNYKLISVCSEPEVARRVEEHERQRPRAGAEAVAGTEGQGRVLLSQTVDARGGAGAGAEAGGGAEGGHP